MKIKRTKFILSGIQIKSEHAALKLAEGLNLIEESVGIHECEVEIIDPFICPWVELDCLKHTHMGLLVRKMLIDVREQQDGK